MYEVVILNGKDYPVRFGFNALRIFTEQTNKSIADLENLGGEISLSDAIYLVWAGIKDGARKSGRTELRDLSVEDVADLIDEDMETLQKVLDVFSKQFTAKTETEGKAKGAKKAPKKA